MLDQSIAEIGEPAFPLSPPPGLAVAEDASQIVLFGADQEVAGVRQLAQPEAPASQAQPVVEAPLPRFLPAAGAATDGQPCYTFYLGLLGMALGATGLVLRCRGS